MLALRGRKNIDVLSMAGKEYDGGADNGGLKKGGCKSQLSDDPPGN